MIRRRSLAAALLALALFALTAAAQSASAAPLVSQVAKGGFGDSQNDYSWSMAWFKGKLYIGTARSELCVENATLAFYYPKRNYYSASPAPDLHCAASPDDLDLRAEIWQYTPETGQWARVYQSPADIPNPHDPSKMVARDIGFRGMVVYNDALYVGGVTADEYLPQIADAHPPRILRTTDGEHFTALNGAPSTIDTASGIQKPIGYRAMAVYKNRLFVTASGGLTGDGVLEEVTGADGDHPQFRQVSPHGMQIFELSVFNDQLYAGTGTADQGYGVYRTDAEGNPMTFTPVVTGGAGRGKTITSVVSMQPYNGRLYVGASGWYSTLFPSSEMISIAPDDSWDVVVGASRDGKSPVSGLPDGFGNPFNAHFWRMEDAGGALLVGTNDWSWALRDVPVLKWLMQPFFGYDLYATCDGRSWWPATLNAFGDGKYNFGARTLDVTPAGTFLGSANHGQGTAVWRGPSGGLCGPTGAAAGAAKAGAARAPSTQRVSAPARPAHLIADVQRCGTVLSWDGVPGAASYSVVRSGRRLVRNVPVPRRVRHSAAVPDDPPPNGKGRRAKRANLWVPTAPRTLGTTTSTFFVDRGVRAGTHATYSVMPQVGAGTSAASSNLAVTPSPLRAPTFAALRAALRRVSGAGTARTAAGQLDGLVAGAAAHWRRGDRTGALHDLERLRATARTTAHASRAGAADALLDLDDMTLRLDRKLRYAGVSCTP